MQNIGFLFSLEPWLYRIYGKTADFKRACLRHMEFFNTNPMAVGFILGAVGGMEEKLPRISGPDRQGFEDNISRIKKAMASSLAAIGDSLFWGTLRPFCVVIALALAVLCKARNCPHAIGYGLAAYLSFFNIPAVWARWHGVQVGYIAQERLPEELAKYGWQTKVRTLKRLGVALMVITTAVALTSRIWSGPGLLRDGIALALCLALRRAVSSTPACYAVLIAVGCLLGAR